MKVNCEILVQSYRREIEKLLSSNNDDVMLVLRHFKESGIRLFEIKRPTTTFFAGLISVRNPIFDDIVFVKAYPYHDREVSVYVGKDQTKLFFMIGVLEKDKQA
jgi:hypothetical protein